MRYVVCVERGQVQTVLWWEEIRERHQLEQLGVDGIIILNWIFKQCDGERGEGGGGHELD